jgi:ankyrin repeat protein
MSKPLPERPSADHLRKQAKDLLVSYRKSDPEAILRFAEYLPGIAKREGRIALHDAQSVLAREYGQPSWTKLIEHVEEVRAKEGITAEVAESFVRSAVGDQSRSLKRLLDLYPGLPHFNPVCSLVCGILSESIKPGESVDPLGWKPLEYVCYSRVHQVLPESYAALESCAKELLDRGADPNVSHLYQGSETSPLSALFGASCESEHVGITRLLLERGANPNDGESVYHATERNKTEMLEMLVEAGAEISMKDENWGNTPLFFNAGYGPTNPQSKAALAGCKWLLEHGADPNVASSEKNEMPLHAACLSGNTPLILLLLEHGADPSAKTTDGWTPYLIASLTGNEEAMRALEAAGADTAVGETATLLADCVAGNPRRIKLDVDKLTAWELGLLGKLAELGNLEGVRGLLEAGYDIATSGEGGGTPLHFACFHGRFAIAKMLLERGAPVDVRDDCYDATPLGWALEGMVWHPNTEGGYVPLIGALLAAGSDKAEIQRYADSGEKESEALAEVLDLL